MSFGLWFVVVVYVVTFVAVGLRMWWHARTYGPGRQRYPWWQRSPGGCARPISTEQMRDAFNACRRGAAPVKGTGRRPRAAREERTFCEEEVKT